MNVLKYQISSIINLELSPALTIFLDRLEIALEHSAAVVNYYLVEIVFSFIHIILRFYLERGTLATEAEVERGTVPF